jgi:hypothetical protein
VNNRIRGHHIGISGIVFDTVPYTLKATYTKNYGRYNQGESSFFANTPRQLSMALEMEFDSTITNLPLNLAVGVYGDIGKVYQNSAGLTLRISYKDFRRF